MHIKVRQSYIQIYTNCIQKHDLHINNRLGKIYHMLQINKNAEKSVEKIVKKKLTKVKKDLLKCKKRQLIKET